MHRQNKFTVHEFAMADVEAESAGVLSITSLLRNIGKFGRPSGRGLFMFRAMVRCSSSAAILGLCGGLVGGISAQPTDLQLILTDDSVLGVLVIGGGQMFLIGSCIGFVGAAWTFYQSQVREAFMAFDEFPELMRLHLMMNFPAMQFQHMKLDAAHRQQERSRLAETWSTRSMLASAFQTASPAIDVCSIHLSLFGH